MTRVVITMTTDKNLSRKNFLTKVISGWIFISILPMLYVVMEYIIPPRLREKIFETLRVAKIGDLPPVGATIVKFNKKAIALLRTEQGQIRAYSAVCTHLGCIVQYSSDRKVFHCNCHGSEFDLMGKNISGPASSPLRPYRVEVNQDDIIISNL